MLATSYADQCEDLDTKLCDMMMSKKPEVCGDSCMSQFCKRSCGLCPLRCYECQEVNDVSNCTNLITCVDKSDYCFAAQTFTTHFTETYNLGCGSRQACQQYSSLANKRVNVEAGCCNTDNCNNNPPALLKIIPEQVYTTPSSTTDKTVCVNMDDDICTRLAFLKQNPCSDDCIASKMCPHMCKKCFYCLDCNEVTHPENCTTTTVCGYDKECYGLEKLGSNFKPAIQLGCIDNKLCQSLSKDTGHIFGRKRDFSFNGGCCTGDNCNAHPLTPTSSTTQSTTVPTTTKSCTSNPHSCSPPFHRFGSYCYLLGSNKLTKYAAEIEKDSKLSYKSDKEQKQYCQDHCSSLLYFNTTNAAYNVLRMFSSNLEVFIGAEYTHNKWIWTHDQTQLSHSTLSGHYHNENCATFYTTHKLHSRYYTYGNNAVPCTDLYYPLCMFYVSQ